MGRLRAWAWRLRERFRKARRRQAYRQERDHWRLQARRAVDALETERHDWERQKERLDADVMELQTENRRLESTLSIRETEIKELTAVIANVHAIREKETALACAHVAASRRVSGTVQARDLLGDRNRTV